MKTPPPLTQKRQNGAWHQEGRETRFAEHQRSCDRLEEQVDTKIQLGGNTRGLCSGGRGLSPPCTVGMAPRE